ncbi:AAA family ATPase [Salmonella enterica]|nr:AAA family ATPase [Salmonella enterica]EIE5598597.1 AAA family ATPase [Salmonella enterica]EKI2475202.1 AAA family ATPase [Salmonella enterica]EMB7587769.1 AAA family ATPase [Salmonella enterica]
MGITKHDINDYFNLYGKDPHSDYTLSYHGKLVGAISLTGIDPSGIGQSSYSLITDILGRLLQSLPFNVKVEQYYNHAANQKILLRERKKPRSNQLSRNRQAFLNKHRNLNRSSLIWVLSVEPDFKYKGVFSFEFVRYCFNALFDPYSRDKFKQMLSSRQDILLDFDALILQKNRLDDVLSLIKAQLQFDSAENRTLDHEEFWRFQKFIATFNADYLTANPFVTPTDENDAYLLDGDSIDVVEYEGITLLRIGGAEPVYVRFGSVTRFGNDEVPLCAWTNKENSPVLTKGNYVFYLKYQSYSGAQKDLKLKTKDDELTRETLRLKDFLFEKTSDSLVDERINENEHLTMFRKELEKERFSDFKSGTGQAGIAVYSKNKDDIILLCRELQNRMESRISVIWESVATLEAYRAIQPATPKFNYRSFAMNAYQAGAASLIYRSQCGVNEWKTGLDETDEAFYILESDDGVPFFFMPKVSEKLLIIGVGATRSGKTFLAKCIASHFAKFGGVYAAIDIDPGSVPMANFFGEDAGLFELDMTSQRGFNLFSMAKSKDDKDFTEHFSGMLSMMLKLNEDKESRRFTREEKNDTDQQLRVVLEKNFSPSNPLPATFSGFISRCCASVADKLANFHGDGIYANIFDCETDAIGVIDKPVSVYNLADVKDSENEKTDAETISVTQLVHAEILYRVIQLFESPKYRTLPKLLEIDEAHYTFSVQSTARTAINKAKTWFKHGGGMAIWTQSPSHYFNMPDWGTLKSSASVFIFANDRNGSKEDYQKAFSFLTDDEIDLIFQLKRKQQFYIKIPDLNINKVVNLHVESEQYAICTSEAHEASMAFDVWKKAQQTQLSVDEALTEIVGKLKKAHTTPENDTDLKEDRYYA